MNMWAVIGAFYFAIIAFLCFYLLFYGPQGVRYER